jgi:hypothetical protein
MAEPLTTSTSAVATVGLAALLAGAFGQVAADVMMVVLASIAGVVIALSSGKPTTPWDALRFFFGALLASLTLSWAIAVAIGNLHPALQSAYTPTIVAFMIGSQSMRLSDIADKISRKAEKKIEE